MQPQDNQQTDFQLEPRDNQQADFQPEPQNNQQADFQLESQPTQPEKSQLFESFQQENLSNINSLSTSSTQISSKILPIVGIVMASLSLIISIISLILSFQKNETSDTTSNLVAGSFESQPTKISCNLPKSANDIVYLYLSTNSGTTGIFVSPEGNIESFVKESNNAGDILTSTKVIETDTSDIFEQLINNGVQDFTSYEYPNYSENDNSEEYTNWGWLAQIDNSDSSSCEAKGNDAPPAWFNDLKGLIDSKFAQ